MGITREEAEKLEYIPGRFGVRKSENRQKILNFWKDSEDEDGYYTAQEISEGIGMDEKEVKKFLSTMCREEYTNKEGKKIKLEHLIDRKTKDGITYFGLTENGYTRIK